MKNIILFILGGLISLIFLYVVNPHNLGISPDSVSYIIGAENIAGNRGYTINGNLINHWPPFYSVLLGIASAVSGFTVVEVGKYLNAILLFAMIFVYSGILKSFGFDKTLQIVLPILLIFSKPLTVSLLFWSELPFIFILLCSIAMLFYWANNNNNILLFFSGILFYLLLMTRYAGLPFIIVALLFIIFKSEKVLSRLFQNISYFIAPIIFGLIGWYLYSKSYNDTPTDRSFEIHLIEWQKLTDSYETLKSWFLSSNLTLVAFVVIMLIALRSFISYKALYKYAKENIFNISFVFLLIFSYYLFIIFSISFFDAGTPMDNRILSPIFPLVLIIFAFFINFVSINVHFFMRPILLLLLGICLLVSSYSRWNDHYNFGDGYSGVGYQSYGQFIDNLTHSSHKKIYTNAPELVRLFLGENINVIMLPPFNVDSEIKKNGNENEAYNIINQNLLHKSGVIIFFNKIKRDYVISEFQLRFMLNEYELKEYEEGFILE